MSIAPWKYIFRAEAEVWWKIPLASNYYFRDISISPPHLRTPYATAATPVKKELVWELLPSARSTGPSVRLILPCRQ